MRHITRIMVLALVGVLLVVAPVSATTTSPGALSSAKVVIIVGPTGSATTNYRTWADNAYAEAIQYSSNVVKIYSPVATWDVVKPALQGASLVIYLGHGNGWPSPYAFDPGYTTKDGLGLNPVANGGDTKTQYYGEPYLENEIKLAPNAVVILNHLCYASGNSEPGFADPTLDVAMQRVDNFGQGFFKAGAAAVIAEGHGAVTDMIRDLFTTQQSIANLWRSQYDYNGNEFSFPSMRSPANTAFMDPETPTSGFYRSLIGNPDLLTNDVTGNANVPADSPSPAYQSLSTVTRLAGTDKYSTSSAISAANFAPGVPVAYVATGLDFPDALAGAALGAEWNGPILLVTLNDIPSATAAELARLQPQRIVVLGGTGVVSDGVMASLGAYTSGGVTRLAGVNRYETAATMSAANFGPGVPVVYVATGMNFPDALTGASVAGSENGPVLLVSTKGIPDVTAAELSRLQPQRIVVLGGTGVVPDAVMAALSSFTDGPVTRLAGKDRYATAAAISASKFNPGVSVVYVATGLDFPDALSGAAVAGSQDVPILLVSANVIPSATAAELTRLHPASIVLLGAATSVSDSVRIQLQAFTH